MSEERILKGGKAFMYPLFDELMLMPDDDLRDLYFEMSRFLAESPINYNVSSYFRTVYDYVLNAMAIRFARSVSVSSWDRFFIEYHEFITV